MSDTPETDKLLADWMKGRSQKIPDFAALARRLERERDEAIHGSCVNYNFTQDARRERDAAREQVEELTAVIKGLRAIMRQEGAK